MARSDHPCRSFGQHFVPERRHSEGRAARLFETEDADAAPRGAIGLKVGQVMGSFLHVVDSHYD